MTVNNQCGLNNLICYTAGEGTADNIMCNQLGHANELSLRTKTPRTIIVRQQGYDNKIAVHVAENTKPYLFKEDNGGIYIYR